MQECELCIRQLPERLERRTLLGYYGFFFYGAAE